VVCKGDSLVRQCVTSLFDGNVIWRAATCVPSLWYGGSNHRSAVARAGNPGCCLDGPLAVTTHPVVHRHVSAALPARSANRRYEIVWRQVRRVGATHDAYDHRISAPWLRENQGINCFYFIPLFCILTEKETSCQSNLAKAASSLFPSPNRRSIRSAVFAHLTASVHTWPYHG